MFPNEASRERGSSWLRVMRALLSPFFSVILWQFSSIFWCQYLWGLVFIHGHIHLDEEWKGYWKGEKERIFLGQIRREGGRWVENEGWTKGIKYPNDRCKRGWVWLQVIWELGLFNCCEQKWCFYSYQIGGFVRKIMSRIYIVFDCEIGTVDTTRMCGNRETWHTNYASTLAFISFVNSISYSLWNFSIHSTFFYYTSQSSYENVNITETGMRMGFWRRKINSLLLLTLTFCLERD